MSTRIGCDNLVYALMKTEDTATTAPTYDAVKSAPGVISVNINPNSSQETLFADDGPMETATTLGKIDVEINKAELTTENKADLLGHEIDTNGGIVYGDSDVPPWVAIGFRRVGLLTLRTTTKLRVIPLISRLTQLKGSSLSLITSLPLIHDLCVLGSMKWMAIVILLRQTLWPTGSRM